MVLPACLREPIENGDLQLCIQDCYMQPIVLGVVLVGVACRLMTLGGYPAGRDENEVKPPPFAWKVNAGCAGTLVVLRTAVLALDLTEEHTPECADVGDSCAVGMWVLVALMAMANRNKRRLAGRGERLSWLVAFLVAVVRLRTDIFKLKDDVHDEGSSTAVATQALRIACMPFLLGLASLSLCQPDTAISLPSSSKIGPLSGSSSTKTSKASSNACKERLLPDAAPLPYGIPQEDIASKKKIWGMDRSSLASRLTFQWLQPLLAVGRQRPLEHDDMQELPEKDTAAFNSNRLGENWEEYGMGRHRSGHRSGHGPKPTLFWTLHATYGAYFWVTGSLKLINDGMVFAGPLLLNRVVTFLEDKDEPLWHGFMYAAGMWLASEIQSLAMGQYFFRGFRQGLHVRAGICSNVFSKSLRLTNNARSAFGIGRIVSLMQIDAQKIQDAVPYLHLMWSAPLQLGVAIYLLHKQVGVSAFAGLAILVLLLPFNVFVSRKQANYTRKTMKARDERIKLVNEIISGIRVVKQFAWETSYFERVAHLRNKEMASVRMNSLWGAFSSFLWGGTPTMVSLACFASYTGLGNELTASTAFTALALFNVLRFPLNALPSNITRWIDVSVSVGRLYSFLLADEVEEHIVDDTNTVESASRVDPNSLKSPQKYVRSLRADGPVAIRITNGSFSWLDAGGAVDGDNKKTPKARLRLLSTDSMDEVVPRNVVLRDINVAVARGGLVCIVGKVGSGKSSLVSAMLNEIQCDQGSVRVEGSIAYCAQQAWIQNATVKDNILFGKTYNAIQYEKVLKACALADDLEVLPGGDETEIGERGINLSGGQKQRIALARACYSDADVILLDDVLSAVDVHVGTHIVNECLLGLLKDKTVVVVTHQRHWLHHAGHIIVLSDEHIEAQGTYNDVKNNLGDQIYSNPDTDLNSDDSDGPPQPAPQPEIKPQKLKDEAKDKDAPIVSAHGHGHGHGHATSIEEADGASKGKAGGKQAKGEAGKSAIIKEEERERGLVAMKIWRTYASALGWSVFAVLFWMYLTTEGCKVGTNIWLTEWSADRYDEGAYFYLRVYAGLSAVALILVYLRALCIALASVKAGVRIHDAVFWAVLRSPMAFFDTTPIGRILNRLSQDQQTVDVSMRMSVSMLFNSGLMLVGASVTIIYTSPYIAALFLPVGYLYLKVQNYYRCSSRELQRLNSISKSPIYVSFSESLHGSSTIRAFRCGPAFIRKTQGRLDKNVRAALPGFAANRWLAIRLEFLGSVIVAGVGTMAIAEHASRGMAAGLAGLGLTYALEVTQILNWLIRIFTSTELQMVSVERLMQWRQLEPEAPLSMTTMLAVEGAVGPPKSAAPRRLSLGGSSNWPSQGSIVFKDVHMCYRDGLPMVLKGVNLNLVAGQRVGVVGRTGSGKSSLLVALFRLVELAQGTIEIDGVDISKVGLHELRHHISIIPQDPTLFSGTMRSNLDPFQAFGDDALMHALDQCSLLAFVQSKKEGLDMVIEPNGDNLSVGQRQLVCLGRALLKKSKVLVLDEATASIDQETDKLIQHTLSNNIQECTVITIAHRINTILKSDQIVVMADGCVEEVGTPTALQQNPESLFAQLVAGSADH